MVYAARVVSVSGACLFVVPFGDGFIYVNSKTVTVCNISGHDVGLYL